MGISVREVLDLDIFKDARVIAGSEGLERIVSFVDVIEVPDIDKWIRKETLLLTTAFAIHNNQEKLKKLVEVVAKGGAAVLAIKLGRFLDVIPDEVIKMADDLKFPIVCVPLNVAYTDIINSVLSNILDKQAAILRQGDELHQRLNKMVLVGGGLNAVARTLAEVLNMPVFIENRYGELLAFAGDGENKNKYQSLKEERSRHKPGILVGGKTFVALKEQILVPILAGNKSYGLMVILHNNKSVDEFLVLALERSATVAALEIMKDKAILETEIRLKRDFIDELLSEKDIDEYLLVKRAQDFGWNLKKEFTIYAILIDNIEDQDLLGCKNEDEIQDLKTDIYQLLKKYMQRNNLNPIITQRSDGFLVCEEFNLPMASEMKKEVEGHFCSICLSIGISRPISHIKNFKNGYEEASQALWVGRAAWGKGKIYHYDQLGIYRLLFSHKDQEFLIKFYREFIEPLVIYDLKNGTDMVKTLEQYYYCNSNVMLTAESLYIHRNTLNYRLKRIKEILALDIDEPEQKICLIMAMKIKHLLNQHI
ncbi:MAG: PucR family transcriptional regulator ligand-binding domain-containing protein [Peptococcales bacterium]